MFKFYKTIQINNGDFMKKIIIILIILFLIKFSYNDTQSVFLSKVEYSNLYEITCLNNISTNNFLNYFNDIKIIWIKPKINILYKDKMLKFNKYYFKEISNDKNIENFKNEYINYIKKIGYKSESLKLKTSGIMIEKIKVYLNEENLIYIKQLPIDIKIENVG